MQATAKTMNVMFTSVGRRVELVRAFRDAYSALGLAGNIIGTDIDRLAPAFNIVDRPYLVPRTDTPEFVGAILDICQKEKVDLVFPLTDHDIPVLAAYKQPIRAAGAAPVVIDPEPAAITGDKLRTNRFFASLGLPVGRCWEPEQALAGEVDYPLFLKPRQGSASQHTHRIADADELAFYLPRVPNPLLQEYLSGAEVTNDVICSLQGEVLAVVSRQRIEVRWGEVQKGVTIHDPAIQEGCLAVARGLNAVGPITVQCIVVNGRPHFTEVNARYGGGCPLGVAAGANSPLWLLAEAAGIAVDIPPLGTYREGLFLSRYDTSMFID
jgi:carbamoyl-phosphate synthase large subunit